MLEGLARPRRTGVTATSSKSWTSFGSRLLAGDRSVYVLIAILIGAAAIHIPILSAYFHGDDFVGLVDVVIKPRPQHLWEALTFQDSNFYWRPLGQAYYVFLYSVGGLNATLFHAANLTVFLITIVLIFLVTLRLGLPKPVALLACLIFAFYPNHAISVAWITNGPRLLSMMFVMISLLFLTQPRSASNWRLEVLAWLSFLTAALFDETTLALAPLPVLLSLMLQNGIERRREIVLKLLAYGGLVAVLTPPQFVFSPDDEPRAASYAFGPHIIEQVWALSAQLVLPWNSGSPLMRTFSSISALEWSAGAVAVLLAAILFLLGSTRTRFLLAWLGLSLASFSLWGVDATAPRYVYLAACPFAILIAWLLYAGTQWLTARTSKRWLLAATIVPFVLAVTVLGGWANMERNQEWKQASEEYRVLATGLKKALPVVETDSRIIIYYGIWDGFSLWPDVVARSIYQNASLDVVNIPPEQVEAETGNDGPKDLILYYNDGEFTSAPRPN